MKNKKANSSCSRVGKKEYSQRNEITDNPVGSVRTLACPLMKWGIDDEFWPELAIKYFRRIASSEGSLWLLFTECFVRMKNGGRKETHLRFLKYSMLEVNVSWTRVVAVGAVSFSFWRYKKIPSDLRNERIIGVKNVVRIFFFLNIWKVEITIKWNMQAWSWRRFSRGHSGTNGPIFSSTLCGNDAYLSLA